MPSTKVCSAALLCLAVYFQMEACHCFIGFFETTVPTPPYRTIRVGACPWLFACPQQGPGCPRQCDTDENCVGDRKCCVGCGGCSTCMRPWCRGFRVACPADKVCRQARYDFNAVSVVEETCE
ncbi:hypothetical protein V1264_016039 [Littorina saxatilis]|uniref:WAP domain-containing protein n=1 Tax=Littorina saxatilis TaxID=31220 RepID=A0AAN9BNB7_9CAEN